LLCRRRITHQVTSAPWAEIHVEKRQPALSSGQARGRRRRRVPAVRMNPFSAVIHNASRSSRRRRSAVPGVLTHSRRVIKTLGGAVRSIAALGLLPKICMTGTTKIVGRSKPCLPEENLRLPDILGTNSRTAERRTPLSEP
jgi:hypothetical protein